MVTLEHLQRLQLKTIPPGQVIVSALLAIDYRFPRRTEIVLEGQENLPRDRSVFLAMNHTDMYNYWPLQHKMHRLGLRMTTTWVKPKYYKHAAVSWFLDSCNNMPVPSRGYVIAAEFKKATGHPPSAEQYRYLRRVVDEGTDEAISDDELRRFMGDETTFAQQFEARFQAMMGAVIDLNRKAIRELKLNVLVFPQGTRSKRLSRGLTGMIQVAHHLNAAVVPIGCNGSDRVYKGGLPFAGGGRIVYRFGRPIEPDGPEFAPHRIAKPYTPLTREASRRFAPQFQGMTNVVMDAINELLDEEYRYSDDRASDRGVEGVGRFI